MTNERSCYQLIVQILAVLECLKTDLTDGSSSFVRVIPHTNQSSAIYSSH